MLTASERPLIVAGGGIINADAAELLVEFAELTGVPVVPTLMGWGTIPDDHELNAGMVGLQTSHRYGNATFLESDFVLGIGNRWANRHTGGLDVYTRGPHVRARRHRAHPDRPGLRPRLRHRLRRQGGAGAVRRGRPGAQGGGRAARPLRVGRRTASSASGTLQRRTHFDDVPIKPQRVYEEMNKAFGPETRYVTTIGLSQIAGAQMLHVYRPRHWINCGQAGPLGWTIPAALGVATADPEAQVVALSGDYDFQFMIEELAVGAQLQIPYIHVLVNNAYLGLIRQAQRGFDMDFQVKLAFDNINSPELGVYGVDHVKVAEGLGCKAIRVTRPGRAPAGAFEEAKKLAAEYRVPVVVEVILERVTNISMGTETRQRHRVRGAGRLPARTPRRPSPCSTDREVAPCTSVAPDKFKGSLDRGRGRRARRRRADRRGAGSGRRRACRSPTAATAPWTRRRRRASRGSRSRVAARPASRSTPPTRGGATTPSSSSRTPAGWAGCPAAGSPR